MLLLAEWRWSSAELSIPRVFDRSFPHTLPWTAIVFAFFSRRAEAVLACLLVVGGVCVGWRVTLKKSPRGAPQDVRGGAARKGKWKREKIEREGGLSL